MNDLNKQFLENLRTWGEFLNLHFYHHDVTRETNELVHFPFLPGGSLVKSLMLMSFDLKISFPSPKMQSLPWIRVYAYCVNYFWISAHLIENYFRLQNWLINLHTHTKRPTVKGSRVTFVSLCDCPISDLFSGQCELTKCNKRHLETENLCTCK